MHALFILDDIAIMFVDDFMALPHMPMICNVMLGMPAAMQRHHDLWTLTH